MSVRGVIFSLMILAAVAFGAKKIIGELGRLQAGEGDGSAKTVVRANLPSNLSLHGLGQFLRSSKDDISKQIKGAGISDDCATYVKSLESMDLMKAGLPDASLSYSQLPEVPHACVLQDDWVASGEKVYLQNCFLSNPNKTDAITPACLSGLFGLRATITRFLNQNRKVTEIHSLPDLVDLMYAEILVPEMNHEVPNFRTLVSIARQIDHEQRGLYLNERILMIGKVSEGMTEAMGKSPEQQDAIWEKLSQEWSENSSKVGGLDTTDIDLALNTRGYDPTASGKYSARLLSRSPDSPLGYFLKSYAEWAAGEQEASFQTLKKAMELDPSNQDYIRVNDLLKAPGASVESFRQSFHFSVSTLDFDK